MVRSALRIASLTLALGAGAPVSADSFRSVTDRSDFVALVQGRDLTRLGVTLTVTADGAIRGRAFGRAVTGVWNWQGSYFCRDMNFGSQNIGANCQQVLVNGDTVRFIADQGAGDRADLTLR